jgi:ligand-binding sensor domain-containing protein
VDCRVCAGWIMPVPYYGFSQDKAQRIWFSGQDYVGCIEGDTVRRRALPFPIQDIHADSSGGIWCMSDQTGVYHFPNEAAVFSEEPILKIATDTRHGFIPLCITEDREGRLIIGAQNGIHRFTDDTLRKLRDKPNIFMVHQDRTGVFWIALWRYAGLVRLEGDPAHIYTTEHRLPADYIRWITEDRAGRLWVATIGGGVCHIAASDVERRSTAPQFIPLEFNKELRNVWISRITEDGRVECGFPP